MSGRLTAFGPCCVITVTIARNARCPDGLPPSALVASYKGSRNARCPDGLPPSALVALPQWVNRVIRGVRTAYRLRPLLRAFLLAAVARSHEWQSQGTVHYVPAQGHLDGSAFGTLDSGPCKTCRVRRFAFERKVFRTALPSVPWFGALA